MFCHQRVARAKEIFESGFGEPKSRRVGSGQHRVDALRVEPAGDFSTRRDLEARLFENLRHGDVTAYDAVTVIGKHRELHARVAPRFAPPGEHPRELLVRMTARRARAVVPEAEFVRGMVGLADPKDRDVAESINARIAQLFLEKKVDREARPLEVGEFERHAVPVVFDERLAGGGGFGRIEFVHARDDVCRVAVRVHVLQTRAPDGIRAVDPHRHAALAQTVSDRGNGDHAATAFRAFVREHGLEARAAKDRLFGLHAATEVRIRNDAVILRAKAREDPRMVHVGFGREVRAIVRPHVAFREKTRERGHFLRRDGVGAEPVEAHDQKAGMRGSTFGFGSVVGIHHGCGPLFLKFQGFNSVLKNGFGSRTVAFGSRAVC